MMDIIHKIDPKIKKVFITNEDTEKMYNFGDLIPYYQKHYDLEVRNIQQYLDEKKVRTYHYYNNVLDYEFDLSFIGLRKEESFNRRMNIVRYGHTHTTKKGNTKCYPLYNWKTHEIELYLRGHNLPVLDVYTTLGFNKRTISRIRSLEQLEEIKIINPESYNKLKKCKLKGLK